MPVLILVVIGFALMFGHHDLAKSLVKPFIGLVLVLSLLPMLLNTGLSMFGGTSISGAHVAVLCLVLIFAVIGLLLWHGRTKHGHGSEEHRPRQRALPPAPNHD